jgi:general secretion pathway protein A
MYSDHFGLSGQPFQLTPDARFWFASRAHKKAMAYLGYGLAQAEGFIVITGEVGAGKSTLVGHLLATIDRARLNALSIVSTQVEGDDMLRLVAQGLGLKTGGVEKARLLDLVEQRLTEESRGGKRTLLIVDEAQNLPVSALEELRMLSNFTVAGRALLQIFLLGQPEFRERLAGAGAIEQLRQRVIANHHESHGIPRRVNQLANRLMLFAAIESRSEINSEAVAAVVADMGAEPAIPARSAKEAVLPLRSVPSGPRPVEAAQPYSDGPDKVLLRTIAALEGRIEEQEAALRRVLTMLVDWVENGEPGLRSNAA